MGGFCSKASTRTHINPDTITLKQRSSTDDDQLLPAGGAVSKQALMDQCMSEGYFRDTKSAMHEFLQAVEEGNETMMLFYINEYPSVDLCNAVRPGTCHTALHLAARNGHYNVTQQLLQRNASINATGDHDETAMHMAVREGHVRVVKLLIEHEADLEIINEFGETAMSIARELRHTEMIRIIANELQHLFTESPSLDLMTPNDYTHNKDVPSLAGNPSQLASDILAQSGAALHAPRNTIAIGKLDTKRLQRISSDIFAELRDDVSMRNKELVPLSGWLKRQKGSPPFGWLKRWCVVKEGHLLWSERQMTIEKGVTEREKLRWNTVLNLRFVEEIETIQNKKNKFMFRVQSKSRKYVFRCENKQARDAWMQALQMHREHAKMQRLVTKKDVRKK